MYLPRAFVEEDPAALERLLARDPFVTLVTVQDGLPFASHLPVLHARRGDALLLEGHWARPNPQSAHGGAALVVVHGPHAYVSPAAYPDKVAAARVPTWNYALAHLHGRLEPVADEDALGDLVARMSARFESSVGSDWRFDADDPAQRRQLRGIVGFRFHVERAALKFKLSQNLPVANVEAVAAALAGRDPAGAEVAALMREHLAKRRD
uniref:FMN-binding negative transcriptional regulator n=1 Tax=Coralloluteibacterium stylophorae TaxID=1776034 RepID=A0A8J7VTK5_9GAMM